MLRRFNFVAASNVIYVLTAGRQLSVSSRLCFPSRPFWQLQLLSTSKCFSTDRPWYDLNYTQFKQRVNKEDIQLIDVREPYEYKAGQIQNSINIPLGEVEHALKMSDDAFMQKYGTKKPSGDDTNIVFHCMGGVRSRKAMNLAHSFGYNKASHYLGGYAEWVQNESEK